ncbi:hypothetical protein [Carboxylicivirga linearis]|uniref:Uncharacterized protein n=1 Tax=Carboxylicivirga linearis TaxID=1628157 RepID=A0ABS5JYM2_9BACT|nr:hypothetical protein [Carboxylicivirga linearis]MBS2100008.1 hypothetical protein [Carboxylicivirga linearis]
MNKDLPHIGIDIPEDVPDEFLELISNDVKAPGLNIEFRKHSQGVMMAALDWVVPTAIAAYIFKPYFEAFLKEAGKDHYNVLKKWLKKFVDNGRAIKVHRVTATQSPNKLNKEDSQSKAVSLYIQSKSGQKIKLLFDNDLTQQDWDQAIDSIMDLAKDNYENFPNDKLTTETEKFDYRTFIYAVIDRKTKQFVFYDDNDLLRIHKEENINGSS